MTSGGIERILWIHHLLRPVPVNQSDINHSFNIHQNLAFAIKSSLTSGRDKDPAVRLEVPFNKLLFQGGMKAAGSYFKWYEVRNIMA